jgi:formylmethanofuran dehydrogenase subunit A
MTQMRISGGRVYDPANGVDGDVRDVCVDDGRIVDSVPPTATRVDARGMVVMPGGVDMHCHVAGGGVNVARRLLPEDHARHGIAAPNVGDTTTIPRSGSAGTVPTTFTTGYRYAGLGYTTVFDAAVAPVAARGAHAQLDDTPCVDGGFFALLGNDDFLIRLIDAGERERAREYAAWMLGATGAYAIKIVNPGGVELWKRGSRERTQLDTPLGSSRVSPRAIVETLVDAANALGLPHGAHIHGNNLGVAGNVETTLATMAAIDGKRVHFTHLQFHSYGKATDGGWRSAAREIIDHVNTHPTITGDVGQVMFGSAVTLTADAPVEYLLHKSSGRKWANVDIELETGCGVVPHEYKDRNAVAALQWAVGLELFLLAKDPWRVVLSTDHPNGASFMSYPTLIRLLMDRAYRDEQIAMVEKRLLMGSALTDGLSREYSLGEIAIITRAGPARILGLRNKGHLGIGADADVTVYMPDDNHATMFSSPRYVVKSGELIVHDGELRRIVSGKRLHVRPAFDLAVARDIQRYFDDYGTVRFANFPVGDLVDVAIPVTPSGAR